ncbi:MarR family winged helix-turn-helix transcriptional regulator [Dermatobacter hominis]|uniref:MarR family winged helix-turn-helix transcriptional regulator n=1 Tax=Dermatobacter hominis TaxID=2884263 RepID=UPI001D12B579|nr:MarR family transcriptional regulator [Dermatobacter hominis]UDY34229.1 MarR family transcriptional regulator [Dermatobacter hominis]
MSPSRTTSVTPAAPAELVAEGLLVSTVRLARRLRQLSDARLTPSQHSVMTSINRHGPLTLGALAEVERVAPPTISRVVAKLESDGLVERRTDPTDGRIVRVVVTDSGADMLAAARSRKVAWLGEHLSQLSPEDRDAVAAAIGALERLVELP